MQKEMTILRGLPTRIGDRPDARDEWANCPVSSLSDARLIGAVAQAIAKPKRDADSSFLTHAPLELAARGALLSMVEPHARDSARRRIAAIASRYAGEGEEIEDRPLSFADEAVATGAARRALKEGDAETLDGALLFLARRVSPLALRRALASDILPMLGAAGHAPIFIAELPRLEARLASANALLRAPMRKLARAAQLRLAWHETAVAKGSVDDEAALMEALRAPPHVRSSSAYIAPTMHAVEANGFAEALLAAPTARLPVSAAQRVILRAGAMSMLEDDPAQAPYGWSHALTMPQGVFACADVVDDKQMLVRIAATYALGFRATLGKAKLTGAPPPRPRRSEIFDVAPVEAAGAVHHAPDEQLDDMKTKLATRAATHEDAHLAKYTLAAFDAAARDPEAARLFLGAAAYLGAWWDAHPGASFE